jgi:hypothetical protein
MTGFPMRRGKLVQDSGVKRWVIYEPSSDSLHELNDSARAIWELCDGETDPEEMARAISEITGMEFESSASVVKETIDSLAARNLIRFED